MSTHTPGPWTVERINYSKGLDVSFEVKAGRSFVCQTVMREIGCDDVAIRTDEANTRLIAAAPDLLENARLVLKAFAAGVFVRNVADDDKSDWAIRAFPHITALARLEVAVAKAEAKGQAA